MDERIRSGPEAAFDRLTERQKECLRLLALPCAIKEVGARLNISASTVTQHLADARRLLGTPDSKTAARLLIEHEGPTPPIKTTSSLQPIADRPERRFSVPWRTREHPINDLNRRQRIFASLALTIVISTVAGIIIIAIVLLMDFLIDVSRHGV